MYININISFKHLSAIHTFPPILSMDDLVIATKYGI